MTILFKILLLAAMLLGIAGANASETAGSFKDDLATRSEYWPFKVKTKKPLDVNKNGRQYTLGEGRTGVLVRVEDDAVLVDFGGHGLHRMAWDETDLLERADELSETSSWEDSGMFASQLVNKFFWPSTLQQVKVDAIEGKDYFLIIYSDLGTPEAANTALKLSAAYWDLTKIYPQLEFWSIPMDATKQELMEALPTSGISWPVMVPRFRKGYTESFQHNPSNPSLVLVDKNGRILIKLTSDGSLDSIADIDAISEAIDTDIAMRQS